jgi:hypothetical protein
VGNKWTYGGESRFVLEVKKDTIIMGKSVFVLIARDSSHVLSVRYVLDVNDSIFYFNEMSKKFDFYFNQKPKIGDSFHFYDWHGKVVNMDATVSTPKEKYSNLVRLRIETDIIGYHQDFYCKPGIGVVILRDEDGEIINFLSEYELK